MNSLQAVLCLLSGVVVVNQVSGLLGSEPVPDKPFKGTCNIHPGHCEKQQRLFPEELGPVMNYVSMYQDNHSVQALYANMDLTTPEAKAIQEREDMFFSPPQVDTVIEGKAYQARGYALGYPLMLITPEDTLILIDAPESQATGQTTLQAFRAIPAIGTKPIVAVIYTIFHADHVYGVQPYMKDEYSNEAEIKVYAHENMLREAKNYDIFKSFKMPRIFRQYATFVPEPWHINDGGSERLDLTGPYQILYPPTDVIAFPHGQNSVLKNIAGIDMEFVSIPGYTSDQMLIYIQDWNFIHAADAFYSAYPNMYTLRGELARDVLKWAEGTRIAASYQASVMTLTHDPVKFGKENIQEMLNNYADAIQFIHDQTVRYMSKGFPADVIPREVQLPQQLKEKFYLQEIYGMNDISIKGIVDFYVGWFSGYVEDLFPVDRFERAARMVDLVGDAKMAVAAAKAYNDGQYEWALELSSILLRNDKANAIALDIRTECLKRMTEVQTSVLGRNYLMSAIMEDWKHVNNKVNANTTFLLIDLDGAFQQLGFHVDARAAEGKTATLNLILKRSDGTNSIFFLKVYNSILVYKAVASPVAGSAIFATTELYWRLGLARYLPNTPMSALGTMLAGTAQDVEAFMALFDLTDELDGYIPNTNY